MTDIEVRERVQKYYIQLTSVPDICPHCGELAKLSEARDIKTHAVLDVGDDGCLRQEGWL